MASNDTSFVAQVTRIVAAWLQPINDFVFKGRNPNFATSIGAANVYTITLPTGSLYSAVSDGDTFTFKAHQANTTAATYNIVVGSTTVATGAIQINGAALTGNEIQSGGVYTLRTIGTTAQLSGQPLQPLPLSLGGTGAATAAAARAVLGALGAPGVGTDGQVLVADSSQTDGVNYIDMPARLNLLINPNWQIDQINEGALYTYSATAAVGPDGWSGSATGAGVFKLRTLADPDNAALKCLEITCTTADASIAATDAYFIYTAVEGYDTTSLQIGTASAAPITIQFKFKSNSVTGVFGISVANSAKNRSYVGTFTVADTSEHEYVVTLTMDTTGTWLYTNGVGLYARICLAAGSNFQTTAGAWGANNMLTTSAQANFMSANTNIAYLKRIQLIPGALVQAYKPADIQKELAKAQRYYAKTFLQGTAVAQNAGATGNLYALPVAAAPVNANWTFPISMRTAPSITTYNPGAANALWRDLSSAADGPVATIGQGTPSNNLVAINFSTAPIAGDEYGIHVTANARLA